MFSVEFAEYDGQDTLLLADSLLRDLLHGATHTEELETSIRVVAVALDILCHMRQDDDRVHELLSGARGELDLFLEPRGEC